MLQQPNLSDDRIVACLRDHYGLAVIRLEFLPLGCDNFAWAYRVGADGGATYFLKVRKGPVDEIGLAVPRSLAAAGVWQAVAPLGVPEGKKPWGSVDDYALVLYPFIQGRSAMEQGLTDAQWIDYGATLRAIHRARLPDTVWRRVPRDSFVSPWVGGVRRLQATIERTNDRSPHARALAAIWLERRDKITHLVERAEALGRRLQGQQLESVLCHTDPHTGNLLLAPDGRLFVVDWDAPLRAPKERDLHFVVGSVIGGTTIGPREEGLIFRGYGRTTINWPALTYYRDEWVCGDLLAYGECALGFTDAGEATRADAVRATRRMFAAGDAVASADALERRC